MFLFYHLCSFLSFVDWSFYFRLNRKSGSWKLSSVTQSCPTSWDPMDCSMPGLPVHHQLLEFTQTHVYWVGDDIQPSHPLSSPFPSCAQSFPALGSFQMSQFFTSGGQNIGVSASASVLTISNTSWYPLGLTVLISMLSKDSQESSPAPWFESINSLVLSLFFFFGVQLFLWSNSHICT